MFNNNNKTILVTGCAGFIGSNFLPYFLEKYPNYNLVNLDLLTYAGDLENLKAADLKEFITKRVNEKLAELGYNPMAGGDDFFEFDEKKASELDWFYHLTGGVTHTDFFALRPTDYSKAGEGENWDDIF